MRVQETLLVIYLNLLVKQLQVRLLVQLQFQYLQIGIREAFTDIVEIEIDTDTQTGTFVSGETVKGISNISDQDVSFTVFSIITDANVSINR